SGLKDRLLRACSPEPVSCGVAKAAVLGWVLGITIDSCGICTAILAVIALFSAGGGGLSFTPPPELSSGAAAQRPALSAGSIACHSPNQCDIRSAAYPLNPQMNTRRPS